MNLGSLEDLQTLLNRQLLPQRRPGPCSLNATQKQPADEGTSAILQRSLESHLGLNLGTLSLASMVQYQNDLSSMNLSDLLLTTQLKQPMQSSDLESLQGCLNITKGNEFGH